MNFRTNLNDLVRLAHTYQYKEPGLSKEENQKRKPSFYYTNMQWVFVIVSILIAIFSKGFSNEFCGYIISGLSLFVGVFFTFLVTLYDKFKGIDFTLFKYEFSQENYRIGERLLNYFKRITVLSLYAAVISILSICLLSINLLTDYFSASFENLQFVETISEVDYNLTLQASIVLIYKCCTIYFLLDFLLPAPAKGV